MPPLGLPLLVLFLVLPPLSPLATHVKDPAVVQLDIEGINGLAPRPNPCPNLEDPPSVHVALEDIHCLGAPLPNVAELALHTAGGASRRHKCA